MTAPRVLTVRQLALAIEQHESMKKARSEWANTDQYAFVAYDILDVYMATLRAYAAVVETARPIIHSFDVMPDALLTVDDPRYEWWMATADVRAKLRAALREIPEESKS